MGEIEVFADVSCPFSHAVLRRFVQCRKERAPEVTLRVRAWALELVDGRLPDGKARGVQGSPHFYTPDGNFFCPGLDVRRVDGTLRISSDPETFDRFLAACFGPR